MLLLLLGALYPAAVDFLAPGQPLAVTHNIHLSSIVRVTADQMGASEPAGRDPKTYASVARVRPSAAKQGVTAVVPGFNEFKKISDASSRVATSTTKPPTNGSTTTLAKLKDGWAIDGWNGDSATQPSIPRPPSSGHKVFAEEESDEFKRSGRGSEEQARACVAARRAVLASLLASLLASHSQMTGCAQS